MTVSTNLSKGFLPITEVQCAKDQVDIAGLALVPALRNEIPLRVELPAEGTAEARICGCEHHGDMVVSGCRCEVIVYRIVQVNWS